MIPALKVSIKLIIFTDLKQKAMFLGKNKEDEESINISSVASISHKTQTKEDSNTIPSILRSSQAQM